MIILGFKEKMLPKKKIREEEKKVVKCLILYKNQIQRLKKK